MSSPSISPSSLQEEASPSGHQPTIVPPIRIAVMGTTGSGKTQFINLASGSDLRVGMDLESCTAEVQLADEFTLDGRQVILIDTPGFDDTSKCDADILKIIAAFLATTYERGDTLSGVIYIHRISDRRFTGVAGRNLNMFRQLCGDAVLKNVVLVTNMWGDVSPEDGEDRENRLSSKFFRSVLDLGAQMARHHNTVQSAHDIVRKILVNGPVVLQIQRELVDENKDITDTVAGEYVSRELNDQMKRHQAELKKVEEEMAQALKEKDGQTVQELEAERRRMQEQMEKTKMESYGMSLGYGTEKARMKAKMKEMEQEVKRLQDLVNATTVAIPIDHASDDKNEVGRTGPYLSTCRVGDVRDELQEDARRDSSHGETEGTPPEDACVPWKGAAGGVSKLASRARAVKAGDVVRDVKERIAEKFDAASDWLFDGIASMLGLASHPVGSAGHGSSDIPSGDDQPGSHPSNPPASQPEID